MLNKNLLNELFPLSAEHNKLPELLKRLEAIIQRKESNNSLAPRLSGKHDPETRLSLMNKYAKLPDKCADYHDTIDDIVDDLFSNAPRWRSPNLQYNVGAPVNIASSSVYSLALDENIYNINDGLSGNALIAEISVSWILSSLAKIKTKAYGIFTFGGTATNLYAIKIGSLKASPDSSRNGVDNNLKVFVTEDSHFSHSTSANWLGIGTKNVVTIKRGSNGATDVNDAKKKLRLELENGNKIAAIIINGGTTYEHIIDNIDEFAQLRDKLVADFNLEYIPHIHVDSVIGWAWLMFGDYDYAKNPLNIHERTLELIKSQYDRIKSVNLADSWGVDFHKGVGGCPVDTSIIIVNDYEDLFALAKNGDEGIDMHQLANDFSSLSPVEYTLETSRAGGAALSALTALHVLGKQGYQANLATLVEASFLSKELLRESGEAEVLNINDASYVTMFRLIPKDFKLNKKSMTNQEANIAINQYSKNFFKWYRNENKTPYEFSFSDNFRNTLEDGKISGIKLYPVSPHVDEKVTKQLIKNILEHKHRFDSRMKS